MTDELAWTFNYKIIDAPREVLYNAFLDPEALTQWLPPDEMTGEMHSFDARVGGGYRMSLFYPVEQAGRGKTNEREDSVIVRFVELTPPERIVQAVTFQSDDPACAGEMSFQASFEPVEGGTKVAILCTNLPPGIRREDNAAGCQVSLEQLARYVG